MPGASAWIIHSRVVINELREERETLGSVYIAAFVLLETDRFVINCLARGIYWHREFMKSDIKLY